MKPRHPGGVLVSTFEGFLFWFTGPATYLTTWGTAPQLWGDVLCS